MAIPTLIIPDLHLPFVHPQFLRFVKAVARKYKTRRTVCIGDIVDLHALSFHEHDVDGLSAGDEVKLAKQMVKQWYKAFPKASVCIGNHDARTIRLARKAGLPLAALKDMSDLWGTPGWTWDWEFEFDGVLYSHGTGCSGKDAAYNLAIKRRKPVVIGHTHANAGVKYQANVDNRIFGLAVGCGIDVHSYAFHYGKDFVDKPMLGCGVIDNEEIPHFIPMKCSLGEKYAR